MRKHVSCYAIFEYWYGKNDLNGNPWIIDPGEKMCFKCGLFDSEIKKGESLKAFWNRQTKLEKAHIVPHALGGSDEPMNIILLCNYCHRECPDTIDYYSNLKWISDNRKPRYFDEINKVISQIDVKTLEKINKISPLEFKELLFRSINTHGFEIANSTVEVALKEIVKEVIRDDNWRNASLHKPF